MRTITDVSKVNVTVRKEDLMDSTWLQIALLSKKLKQFEIDENVGYKSIRTKWYNSQTAGKYNIEEKWGIKCINVKEPMKAKTKASLELSFTVEE